LIETTYLDERPTMKRMLVALDASPMGRVVLEHATELARSTGARMLLFRAVSLPLEIPPDVLRDGAALEGVLVAQARADLQKLTVGVPPDLLSGTEVVIGMPWQAICQAATRDDVDLIVIGSHGYGGWDRVLGTTAARVVNHADRAVLVVKPEKKG
jgi:nucleotide-binding universal stress UspA family protein